MQAYQNLRLIPLTQANATMFFCAERNQQMVVYRNALFKGRSKLLSTREHDIGAEFLELEQSNGQTVYLSRLTVVKFCEHGGEFTGEIISPNITPTLGLIENFLRPALIPALL